MTSTYIMEAIPPYCKEKRTPVSVVEWRGDRVLLRDEAMAAKGVSYYIETDLGSFVPDLDAPTSHETQIASAMGQTIEEHREWLREQP